MILLASWSALLESFRPVFRRRGTFTLFTVLATGLVLQAGRRSVVGMLAGAGMASKISFHATCRFFSSAVWDIDALCLIAARLIMTRLLEADAPDCGGGRRYLVQAVGEEGPPRVLDT